MVAIVLGAVTPVAASTNIVTLVAHDSFVISKSQLAEFKKATGITVKVVRAGDAGAMTNKLVLTKSNPIGDAFFGIDNTLRGQATDAGIVASNKYTAIDYGDVCFNYDRQWFMQARTVVPTSWRDLTDPKYRGMTVIEDPNTSSTGLAFLATTVAAFGDGFTEYWKALKANGVKVTAGWEDAYYTEFSGSSGKGTRPIVLSYSTSPADEVRADGKPGTVNLGTECFRQTEYAGVLANAKNAAGAKRLVHFLTTSKFQRDIPATMYMYPQAKVAIPSGWAKWGKPASSTLGEKVNFANRKDWLKSWNEIFG